MAIKQNINVALRLTLVYIFTAGLWILFSDRLLITLFSDPAAITEMQTYKGWFYVLITALLAFVVLDREFSTREKIEKELIIHKNKLEETVKERTKNLKTANEQLSRINKAVEVSSDAIIITETDGRVIYKNKSYTELFGSTPYSLCDGETEEIFKAVISGTTWSGEVKTKGDNAQKVLTHLRMDAIKDDNDGVIGLIAIYTDLTERVRLEKEIAKLEQLHLIGEMAAGIGHEIRNPMTTVRGFLQLFKERKEFLEHNGYFDLMIEELDRANSIISEYLSLAKNKAVDLKPNNLCKIIAAILPLLKSDASLKEHQIKTELTEIPDLMLDEKEIRQLIINLVRNGLESMSTMGQVVIRTYISGEHVVLSIEDNGKGIPPEILDKLGTPFFTTKDNGTGLGLAVCYSIAARHNAFVDIKTDKQGTTFFVRFKINKIN